ncbi:MAG: four-carbon acid sugar kinase family protein [Thermaerobacter sp.]|nr:four-carbon acid sugar kinase family protein [Thermaerobacter sp.]
MLRLFIIADDITGANDTGVQLARRGIDTVVTLEESAVGTRSKSYVLDTESRALPGSEAFAVVEQQTKNIDFSAFSHVVKKIDSTLRGSVAHEVLAVDKAYVSDLIVFMPAFPNLGRTTESGVQMLNGKRVTEAEIARDPKTPVKEDNLRSILKSVYNEEVMHVTLKEIEEGKVDFGMGRVFTSDAITNKHMEAVVLAALKSGRKRILWVGSAGIVDSLMQVIDPQYPALAVVASVSETSREQVRYAEKNGATLVLISWRDLLNGEYSGYVERSTQAINDGKDVVLASVACFDRAELVQSQAEGERMGLSPIDVSKKIQVGIGKIAVDIVSRTNVSGVFLTGGDTAMGFFEQLGARSFNIISEVLIGIPLMRIVDAGIDGMKVITKAGAFGKEDAISYCLRKLKEK